MMSEASRKMAKLNAHGCAMAAANWLTSRAAPGAVKARTCKVCGRSVLGAMRRPVGLKVLAGSALPARAILSIAPLLLQRQGGMPPALRKC